VGPLPSIAVFFVIWWLCLFIVLPFGNQQQDEDKVRLGTDAGAPQRPRLLLKALVTTLLAAILFSVFYVYFNVYHLSLEDLSG
jgi:predicted secreted protein